MTDEHFHHLTHAVGMRTDNYRRKLEWWLDDDKHRNHLYHYHLPPEVAELIDLGWVEVGRTIRTQYGGGTYYHVTPDGVRAAREEFFDRRKRKHPSVSY